MGRPEVVPVGNYVAPCEEFPLGSQMNVGLDPLGCRWLRIKRMYKDHKLSYVVYRQILDMLTEDQFIWQPYTVNVLACLPNRCKENREEYLVRCPLICFYMVEFHFPDRCMRQFGRYQTIPEPCDTKCELHSIDNRTNINDYASGRLEVYITGWNNRRNNLVQMGVPYIGRMAYEDPYMIWFLRHTRRLISPKTTTINEATRQAHDVQPTYADLNTMAHGYAYIYNTSSKALSTMPSNTSLRQSSLLQQFQNLALQQLQNANFGHLIQEETQQPTTPPAPHYNFRHRASQLTQPSMTPIEEGDTPEASTGPSQGKAKKSRKRGN